MYKIEKLSDIRGNSTVMYTLKTLLEKKAFPKFSIFSGAMGVGKTSAAKVVANTLNNSDLGVITYNLGMPVDMKTIREEVFSMNPNKVRAFIFEELHGLDKEEQTALLTMLDNQPENIYIICTSTEIYKILRTIRSRAQCWEFKFLGNKQLEQLLDDYLESIGQTLTDRVKKTLVSAARGVPRDMLKQADFAISGNFDSNIMDAVLDNVSDDLMFSVMLALKSQSADFVSVINTLIEEPSTDKLNKFRDFWVRYVLERQSLSGATLSNSMIETLSDLYNYEEVVLISKALLRANADTLLLELVTLNMTLTGTTISNVVGQQKEKRQITESDNRVGHSEYSAVPRDTKVSVKSVKNLKL